MPESTAAPKTPDITCFGAAHIDRLAQIEQAPIMGTSNPGTLEFGPGGVARNVATALADLGNAVSLISRLGDDPDGELVSKSLALAGVRLLPAEPSKENATATYTALLAPSGDLILGHAEMLIYGEMTPEFLDPLRDEIRDCQSWFVDANLPAEAYPWLAAAAGDAKLFADTVSVAKAPRIGQILDSLHVLFCNRAEAAAILADRDSDQSAGLAAQLSAGGCRSGVVTDGAAPLVAWADGEVREFEIDFVVTRDVTSAGDNLIAGTISGMLRGQSIFEALPGGIARAAKSIAGTGAS